jgi:hypothetical protein
VPGWELNDGEKTHRWGLIRFLKDPQRLHNYWRSTVAEQLVAAPRNKWLATPDAVKGHEQKWRKAPTSDDPFLYYNDGETAAYAYSAAGDRRRACERSGNFDAGHEGYFEYPRSFARDAEQ